MDGGNHETVEDELDFCAQWKKDKLVIEKRKDCWCSS